MMKASACPRILAVLGNYALNGQERGNIEALRALAQVGARVRFLLHAEWGSVHLGPYLDRLGLEWQPIRYARHFRRGMTPAAWQRNLRALALSSGDFRRACRAFRPTHIHAANPHYVMSVWPALALARVPLIYRAGDTPTEHTRLHRLLWRRLILPRVETLVCVSRFVAEQHQASGAPAERTHVIYSHPPVRPEGTSDLPEDLKREQADYRYEGETVVFVGQIAPHKGADVLVEAALRLCAERPSLRVLLAGAPLPGPFAASLVARILAAGLQHRIRLLGYIEDVPGLLALADVHVAPSLGPEAFANTVVEAKRAGVPSVVFASGGLPEAVTAPGWDGMVCHPPEAAPLADALATMLDRMRTDKPIVKAAVARSLDTLGLHPDSFTQAWARVYGLASSQSDAQP